MAFPVIQTTNVTDTAAGTTHVINMPAGIQVGDLLLVFFSTDGDNTISNWGGFTELDQQKDTRDIFGAVGYKIAVGSDTLTITTSVSEPSSAIMYRIDGWESDFIPEISAFVYGTNDSPDPALLTPNWSEDDTLFIAFCASDANKTVSAYPTNYTLSQLNQCGGGNGDCCVGVAGRNYNNPSDDPPVFTLSGSEQWYAWTIAVAPTGAVGLPPTQPQTNSRIADDQASWQGACDVDIIDWDKDIDNEFILSTYAKFGDGGSKGFSLQWKESGGSWADVGSATEITAGTDTVLVDGFVVQVPAGCLTSTISEENEINYTVNLDMASDDIAEIQWALKFHAFAQYGTTYEFQLTCTTETTTETCSCSITTAVGETTAYKDITLKTSLESNFTYKDITLKTSLESIPIYKDITLKTSFSAAPSLDYKDIVLKTTLDSLDFKDMAIKVSLESEGIKDYKDITLKTSITSALTYKDISLKTTLDSLDYKDITLKTSFQSLDYKDIALKTSLESTNIYKDVSLKVNLESALTYKDISITTSLESALTYKDVTLKTTLDLLNYKDISLKTSFVGITYKDIALKVSFGALITSYKNISIKVSLEARPIEIRDFTSSITRTMDFTSSIIRTRDFISSITRIRDFTSNN